MKRTRIRSVSVALATALVAGAAGTAQAATVTDDFSGGTHDQTVLSAGAVEIGTFDQPFDGVALPTGWTGTQWVDGVGAATVTGGALSVDQVLADSHVIATPGSSLRFRATFDGQPFQHVGFGAGFAANTPWAIFSTAASGTLIVVRTSNGTDPETELVVPMTPGPHDFRIDWTATGFVYSIDGTLVATHNVPITAPMSPQASDVMADGPLLVDSMGLRTATTGTFTSKVLDGGDARVASMSFMPTADPAAQVTYQLRSGPTPTAGGAGWSGWVTPSAAPPRRYVQYKATLTTPNVATTPRLTGAAVDFTIDSTAPAVAIGAITTSGTTARVPFTSDDAAATYQCSLDSGAFASCSSPASFSGLAVGPHTVAVQARDPFGNLRTASKSFTIASSAQASDHKAPRVSVPRKMKMAANGKVRLKVRCPADESSCSFTVKLLRKGKNAAHKKTLTVDGGASRTATLRIKRSLRHVVEDRGSLKLTLKVSAVDAAGNVSSKRKSVKLKPAER